MPRTLHTEIEIDAPAATVWALLTDFAGYGEWNPFVRAITAPEPIAVGARLRVTLQPPNGRAVNMRPRVVAYEAERELRWLGSVGIRGLFDGEHRFALEPLLGNRTRFVQSERFSGILARLVWRRIGNDTRAGFEAMNEALATRAALVSNGA